MSQSTPPPIPPPAAWYPDPQEGGLRWWDGSHWTEHRQKPEQSAPALKHSRTDLYAGAFLRVLGLLLAFGLGIVLMAAGTTTQPNLTNLPAPASAAERLERLDLLQQNAQSGTTHRGLYYIGLVILVGAVIALVLGAISIVRRSIKDRKAR